MRSRPVVTNVRARDPDEDHSTRGLLYWVEFTLDLRIRIDGATVRRNMRGDPCLSLPVRLDGQGRKHPVVRFPDEKDRREVEQQVLSALGMGEEKKEVPW